MAIVEAGQDHLKGFHAKTEGAKKKETVSRWRPVSTVRAAPYRNSENSD